MSAAQPAIHTMQLGVLLGNLGTEIADLLIGTGDRNARNSAFFQTIGRFVETISVMLEDLAVPRRPAELAFQKGNPALRRMICGSALLGRRERPVERELPGEGGSDGSPFGPPGCEPLMSAGDEDGVSVRDGGFRSETNFVCARSEPCEAQLTDKVRLW
ncbi:hypothetical protein PC129_g23374 [Phytophthora cactorum]|uniref:Uncharacterized protein n=2 Tax=Phytophthora cactorum TaxID=29920 RepID=A0A8T1EPC2_9STRA|nr:hypothetical protein Pcac1_g22939 [Phytophthora cactorum]KAG2872807.1 hypothetical protein PC114_g26181 [Phytophthora cactorum]KAG2887005.1 hypothetical protein PC115_g20497 [Phytophthora cactorum]KAG2957863.1 hypothetical protein PC118_g23813 [Phytophthora cactorum]KAG3201977.1 hypothetical protein PC129_g23374 [Phytophthora cactorum]